ncbi:OmpA family protein [Pedobacter sp. MR2016-24]|uniref:OmpA family protein n=1 Tax=Pedobacter sp. MR2016-24 TaxID=2994466 RepID=UPI00224554AF|nr:OmpA family protein [Pedobacter sp. MR2016-24]MCX2486421.1 OmpA family protein [Pedobacter sp. MR2016-24]
MIKGVKKIKLESGLVYSNMGSPGTLVVVKPGKFVWFNVLEWLPGTTAEDKKKNIIWLRQTKDRRIIISQMTTPATYKYGLNMARKQCGRFTYYLEASLSGKRDPSFTGLYVRGFCEPKITSSKWSTKLGGADISNKKDIIKYGHVVHLNLSTEGLNGNSMIIELYNRVLMSFNNKILKVYTNIECIAGEVNLEFQDLYSWMVKIDNIQTHEEFYVKVKDKETGKYIADAKGGFEHALYLNIKNEVVTTNSNKPKNNKPVKVGVPALNANRYEPCKFTKIEVTEVTKVKGVAKPETVIVFEDGKTKLLNPHISKQPISRSVFFNFDQFNIRADANGVLSNILQFLLEHQGSIIHLDAHADDRGTDDYNQVLSQKRADMIKKFLVDGGLDSARIIPVGHGESQLKIKGNQLTEAQHQQNRRADISFDFNAHDSNSIVYETIGPSVSTGRDLIMVIHGYDTKKCFTKKHSEKKVILKNIGQALDKGDKEVIKVVDDSNTVVQKIYSDLSRYNPAPLQYIWPRSTTPNHFWYYINSCRYYTNPVRPTVTVKVFPDIQWTLEFKWNFTEAFAYSYGKNMHPYDIETGKKKVIGAVLDAESVKKDGEMSKSFTLGLQAEWDEKSQKAQLEDSFGERIAKALGVFRTLKKASDKIVKSPVNGGKISFEIKAPVIALSAQWSLERPSNDSREIGTLIEIGLESKPLLEAQGKINLWKIFRRYGPDAICPGAGKVLEFILKHMESNLEINFLVIFTGSINLKGSVKGNTIAPKDTSGEIKVEGKIQITLEFNATAKGDIGYAGFSGVIKTNVDTSVTGGYKAEFDKKGISGKPILSFDGVKAKYVAVGTVKWGWFERTFTSEGNYTIVDPSEGKFERSYILGPFN